VERSIKNILKIDEYGYRFLHPLHMPHHWERGIIHEATKKKLNNERET